MLIATRSTTSKIATAVSIARPIHNTVYGNHIGLAAGNHTDYSTPARTLFDAKCMYNTDCTLIFQVTI
jgi:hypothetical protein